MDGFQVALCQLNVVDFSCLVQLICDIVGFYHSNCNGIEQLAIFIPVFWILGKDLLVVLDIGCDGVWAIVPHICVVHSLDLCRASQFLHHSL